MGQVTGVEAIRELVESTETLVDALGGVSAVNGEFHKAHAGFLCEVADHAGYYREALRYLGCIDTEALAESEQLLTAQRLCLSALLGKDVYNFGELLAHPILTVLKGRKELTWLVDLVSAFNAGNLARFQDLSPRWSQSVDIKNNEEELKGKLRLLAIMETAVTRGAKERQAVPFADLAAAAGIAPDAVEHLVMKAMARGLVKGRIDQVAGTVHFAWIQPRVLDKTQVTFIPIPNIITIICRILNF